MIKFEKRNTFQECNATPKLPEKKVQSSAVCFHFPTLLLLFPSDFLCFSLCPGIAGICFVCENEISGGIAFGAIGACSGVNLWMEQAALGNPSWTMHNKSGVKCPSLASLKRNYNFKKSWRRAQGIRKDWSQTSYVLLAHGLIHRVMGAQGRQPGWRVEIWSWVSMHPWKILLLLSMREL